MRARIALLSLLLLGASNGARAGDLDWLVGCWETPDKSAKEVWVKEPDGDLIGFSVTVAEGRVVFYEVLRIKTLDDGSVTYTAHPVGQTTTTFSTRTVSAKKVTFSNPSHDYPQEITYAREGETLLATISALNGENPRSFNKRLCS